MTFITKQNSTTVLAKIYSKNKLHFFEEDLGFQEGGGSGSY